MIALQILVTAWFCRIAARSCENRSASDPWSLAVEGARSRLKK